MQLYSLVVLLENISGTIFPHFRVSQQSQMNNLSHFLWLLDSRSIPVHIVPNTLSIHIKSADTAFQGSSRSSLVPHSYQVSTASTLHLVSRLKHLSLLFHIKKQGARLKPLTEYSTDLF